jgi:hypothetical protein
VIEERLAGPRGCTPGPAAPSTTPTGSRAAPPPRRAGRAPGAGLHPRHRLPHPGRLRRPARQQGLGRPAAAVRRAHLRLRAPHLLREPRRQRPAAPGGAAQGARLHLVTHSRGLVGDLLCLDTARATAGARRPDRRLPPPAAADEAAREQADPALARQREAWAAEAQEARQAGRPAAHQGCPRGTLCARRLPGPGTSLLTDNLDIFLSGLFALVRKFGSLGAQAAGGAIGGPAPAPQRRRPPSGGCASSAGCSSKSPTSASRPTPCRASRRCCPTRRWAACSAAPPAARAQDGRHRRRHRRRRPPQAPRRMFTDWFLRPGDNDLVVDTARCTAASPGRPAPGRSSSRARTSTTSATSATTPRPSGQPLPRALQAGWPPTTHQPARLGEPRHRRARAGLPRGPPGCRPAPLLPLPARHHGQPPRADGERSGSSPAPRPRRAQAHRHRPARPRCRPDGLVALAYGNLEPLPPALP